MMEVREWEGLYIDPRDWEGWMDERDWEGWMVLYEVLILRAPITCPKLTCVFGCDASVGDVSEWPDCASFHAL